MIGTKALHDLEKDQPRSLAAQALQETEGGPVVAPAPVRDRRSGGYTGTFTLPEDRPPAVSATPAPFGGAAAVPGGVQPVKPGDMELTQFGKSFTGGAERMAGAAAGTLAAGIKAGQNAPGKWYPDTPQIRKSQQDAARKLDDWATQRYRHAEQYKREPGSGAWSYIQDVTGQTLPLMMTALGAGMLAGPPAAFLVGATAEGDAAYREAKEAGAPDEQAETERMIVGSLNGAIELLQIEGILHLGKAAKPGIRALVDAAKGRAWGKMAAAGGKLAGKQLAHAVGEGLEEALQEAVGIGAATIHGDRIEVGDLNRIIEAAAGGAVAGGILGGAAIMHQDAPGGSVRLPEAQGSTVLPEAVRPSEGQPGAFSTPLEVGLTVPEQVGETAIGPVGQPSGQGGQPAPAGPARPEAAAPQLGGKAESLYQQFINRFASLEDLSQKAKALGLKVKPGEDPGLRARSYLGVGNKVRSILEDSTYRTTPEGEIEITGEGYKPILDDFDARVGPLESSAKARAQDLQDYETAQRTIYDLQRPAYEGAQRNIVSPEQVADAQRSMTALQTKYGPEGMKLFADIAQRRTAYRGRILHLLVDSGNLSQEQYDRIIAENPHYVPFDRVLDEAETSALPKAKKPFTQARSPVRKIKGSQREIENATESDIKNTYRIMDTAERNTVARSVAKLADSFPGDISPVHVKMVPIKVQPEEIETVRREFREKTGPIVEEVRKGATTPETATTGPMAKLETVVREALMQRGMTEGEAGNYIRKLKQQQGGPVTSETVEGTIREAERIVVESEPVESTIFRPSQFMPKGKVIQYFEQGKPHYIEVSPNLYDAMTGMNEASLGLMTKLMATPANWLRRGATMTPEFIGRNFVRDQWTAMMNSQVGFLPFIDTVRAVGDVLGRSEAYEDWLRSGGSYSGFVELSRPSLRKAVKALTRPGSHKLLRALNIISDMQWISQLLEQATRAAVYKRAVRSGQTAVEAGYTSREGTTDFARRGAKTKDINATIAFFNAGIQGLDKSIRAAKADPVGFTIKGMATLTLPSLLLYLRNRKEDDWDEIPRWQRDLFWCFKAGDRWWRIPKPFLYGQIFGSVVERFAEYVDRQDPRAFDELMVSLYDSISPISGDPAGGLLPTALRPIVENATNWNFFRDRPVVSESRSDLLPPQQYNRFTTETAKALGQKLNYSPAKIENFVQGYFGGSGQYALQAGDKLLNAIRQAKGEEVPGKRPADLADYPLAKGFVVRPPESGQAESIRRFYDESTDLAAKYATWRRLAIEGDAKGAGALFEKSPELLFATETNRSRDQITEFGKEIDRISASKTLSAAQKREMIRRVERDRMEAVQQANTEIAQLKGDEAAVLTALQALRDRSIYKTAGPTIRGGKEIGRHQPGDPHPGLESLVEMVNAEIQRRQGVPGATRQSKR